MPEGEEIQQVTEHTEQLRRIFSEIKALKKLNERIAWWSGVNVGIMSISIVAIIVTIIALILAVPTDGASLLIAVIVDIIAIILHLIALIDKLLIEYRWDPEQKSRLEALKMELEEKQINLEDLIATIEED